jgi:hypothetical protein
VKLTGASNFEVLRTINTNPRFLHPSFRSRFVARVCTVNLFTNRSSILAEMNFGPKACTSITNVEKRRGS